MNNVVKKLLAFSGACAISLTCMANAFAAEFIDMPNNWTTKALENAVKNGLLYGEEAADGSGMKINPDDKITRAQMAAIIVRAFGATKTADISDYTDVDSNAWYYNELSKAVAMNAFRGDGDLMNPNSNITFQECFTVLSQVLQLHIYAKDTECLNVFTDRADLAEWAVPYAAAIVGSGLWDGIEGKLLPTTHITRSQFAVLMDNTVKTYIDDETQLDTKVYEGNVMVRGNGLTLSGMEIDGDLIVGDGVSEDGIILDNTDISRYLLLRGGGKNIEMKASTADKIILITPEVSMYMDAESKAKAAHTCNKTNNIKRDAVFANEPVQKSSDSTAENTPDNNEEKISPEENK